MPAPKTRRFILYYRDRPSGQGSCVLSLQQQEKVAEAYGWLRAYEKIGERTEIEEYVSEGYPQLVSAITAARTTDADLLILDPDGLIRNIHFLTRLYEAEKAFGVRAVFCGVSHDGGFLPTADFLQAAKFETRVRSEKVIAGLAAAKARGRKLGTSALENRPAAAAKQRAIAFEKRAAVLPHIATARRQGADTLQQIADALNHLGEPAPRGGMWSPTQVSRVIGPSRSKNLAGAKTPASTQTLSIGIDGGPLKILH